MMIGWFINLISKKTKGAFSCIAQFTVFKGVLWITEILVYIAMIVVFLFFVRKCVGAVIPFLKSLRWIDFFSLLFLFIVFCMMKLRHCLFYRIRTRNAENNCYKDTPIDDAKEDLLDREDYVNQLVSVLQSKCPEKQALYVGIYGEWGEGKTSVMNLVRNKTKNDKGLVFVDFKSWEHEKREDLPYLLFVRIARRIADCLDLRLSWLLFRYAVMLVPRRFISIAGPIEWMLDLIVRCLNGLTSDDELRYSIGRRLNMLNAKIVVVLDDVDRLESDDIRVLLRVIRTTGDIGRFVYCVLSSREHLLKSLSDKDKIADNHKEVGVALQKIINLELDLPAVSENVYASIFVNRLNVELKRLGLPEVTLEAPFLEIFKYYITNCREVTRLVNELMVRIIFFKTIAKGGDFPVNLDDLIALSIVHLYDSRFWKRLYLNQDLIFRSGSLFSYNGNKIEHKELNQKFEFDQNNQYYKARLLFLKMYLGVEKTSSSEKSEYVISIDEHKAEMECRLMSRECFNMYFTGIIPDLITQNLIKEVASRLSNENSLMMYLKQQNERGRLLRSLDYLEEFPLIQDVHKRYSYIRVLMRLSDETLKEESPFGRDSLGWGRTLEFFTRLSRCVMFMLRKIYEQDATKGGHEFLNIIKDVDVIVMLACAVRWDDRKAETRTHSYFFTDEDYKQIVNLFLSRIKKLQTEEKLIGYPDEKELRMTWRILCLNERLGTHSDLEKSIYLELISKDVLKFPNVVHVMLPYRYFGDCPIMDFSPIHAESLDKDFGLQNIADTLEIITGDMSDGVRRIRDNVLYCLEQYREKGEWPTVEQQELRDHDRNYKAGEMFDKEKKEDP